MANVKLYRLSCLPLPEWWRKKKKEETRKREREWESEKGMLETQRLALIYSPAAFRVSLSVRAIEITHTHTYVTRNVYTYMYIYICI